MSKIYFWADADSYIGYGHFIRTLALAEMLKDDFDCTFFTQFPTTFQKVEVERICKLVALPNNETKFDVFLNLLEEKVIVFLDNYFFSSSYQKQIKNKGCKLVVLSPNDKHHYADVVLNFVETDLAKYSVEPYTRILAGLEWSLLRKPFLLPLKERTHSKKHIVTISFILFGTISFGGTDPYCLTEKAVDNLSSSGFELHCICTSKVDLTRRKDFERQGVICHVDITAQQVAEVFERSFCCILSSSNICLEALSRGSKVLAGYYIQNQERLYHLLTLQRLITGLGDLNCYDFNNLCSDIASVENKGYLKIDFTNQKQRYVNLFKELCR